MDVMDGDRYYIDPKVGNYLVTAAMSIFSTF